MTDGELDELLEGIAPVIRSYVSSTFTDLQKQVSALDAKAAIPGPGVSSLVISSEGRLVALLTDGRTLDVGPVPVKDGAPGADGRDADPARLQALETELASLRSELAGKQSEIDALRASVLTLDDVQGLIDAAGERWMADVPRAKDGHDGTSVSLEDVAPLIAEEVQKVAAAIPVPRDGIDGKDGQAGLSVSVDDVLPVIVSEVQKAVAAIPTPRDGVDGESVELDEVETLIALHVEKVVAALPPGKDGQDGRSVSLDDVLPVIVAEVQKSVAALPAPQDGAPGADGRSVTLDDVAPVIASEVQKAVAALPPPTDGKDGASVDVVEVETLVALHVEKAVAGIPPALDGRDGASVTVEDVLPVILAEVQKAAALIPAGMDGVAGPAGADGTSVTVEDVAPLVVAEVQKAVAAIPVPKDGKDGVGLSGALLDREGHLALTMSDGTVTRLGLVTGRDGRDVDMAEVASLISKELSTWPRPKDGQDGLGFDEFDVLHDGERGFTLQFARGDQVKSFFFTIPSVIYRDLWTDGKTYEKGDAVTFGGCMWVAKEATTAKPDFTPAAAKYWRLAIKEGRKGKDADPAVIEAMVNKAVAKLPKPKAQENPKW